MPSLDSYSTAEMVIISVIAARTRLALEHSALRALH